RVEYPQILRYPNPIGKYTTRTLPEPD
ncbi:hypothetical protein CCACVL1_02671, partial [Corchorus capsularis]